jgi:elongation factor Ts
MGEGTVESTRSAGWQDWREHVHPSLRSLRSQGQAGSVHPRWRQGWRCGRRHGGDEQLGKDLAMHIAASKPKSLDASGVSAELLDTERRVAIEKARDRQAGSHAGKDRRRPVQKYLKDVTLLGQVFVKAEDGKQTIEQLLKAKGASVAGFTLFMVGEGIEKKVDDFAAEVAAQAAAAAAK